MPAEPIKVARLMFKSGSQFDVLTRMPRKEIVDECENIGERDLKYLRLEGCTEDDEPTPVAYLRSEIAGYAIIPWRPSTRRMAGGLIQ